MSAELADYLTAEFEAPAVEEEREAWAIVNDRMAGWALRRLAAALAEKDRIAEQAQAERERLDWWVEDASKGPDRDVSFFEAKLADYHRRQREAGAAGKTYKLPAGDLTVRRTPDVVDVTDEDAFRDWAEGTERLDLLTITVAPAKTPLRKALQEAAAVVSVLAGVPVVPAVPGARVVAGQERYAAKPAAPAS